MGKVEISNPTSDHNNLEGFIGEVVDTDDDIVKVELWVGGNKVTKEFEEFELSEPEPTYIE